MARIIIIGTPEASLATVVDELGEHSTRAIDIRPIECAWDLPKNPHYNKPDHLDLHPNDNWRSKGKRKKRFK